MIKTKQALIIFVRHPVLGKVKTRLAATLGEEAALSIYKKLLQHTLQITQVIPADKFVFYADHIVEDDIWQKEHYFKLLQEKADLGARMYAAFEQVFAKGYHKVCIIGSDCYELRSNIIQDAFAALENEDIVIGPAQDGGYYLLGMKHIYRLIFHGKQWSTDTVFNDTIKSIAELGLRFITLPVLTDIDEVANVPKDWLS